MAGVEPAGTGPAFGLMSLDPAPQLTRGAARSSSVLTRRGRRLRTGRAGTTGGAGGLSQGRADRHFPGRGGFKRPQNRELGFGRSARGASERGTAPAAAGGSAPHRASPPSKELSGTREEARGTVR